jgi:uncharacterized membrane protein YkvA (DUF1232 family)
MSLTITFELTDDDIDHFLILAREAQSAVKDSGLSAEEIVAAAREVFEKAEDKKLPEFIAERLRKLETLVNMVGDVEWKLPEEDQARVLNAMAYFADPEDLIPDRVPGVGFLDDAIMVELVVDDLEGEISAFEEFCTFRSAEEHRRENQGLDPHVGREDWLADKRAVLHHRMRQRRGSLGSSSGRRVRLW